MTYPHQPGSPLFDGAEAFDAYGKEQDKDLVAARDLVVAVPQELHPDTKRLVQSFAEQMAEKLRATEIKYGYRTGWLTQDWEAECRQHMRDHISKGDPRDVAIYCAFMWKRGWSTAEPLSPESTPHLISVFESIIGHLGAAAMQRAPSDDKIIADHIDAAVALAKAGRASLASTE